MRSFQDFWFTASVSRIVWRAFCRRIGSGEPRAANKVLSASRSRASVVMVCRSDIEPDLLLLLGPGPGQRAGERRHGETGRRGGVEEGRHDGGRRGRALRGEGGRA